ncbi:MAG: cob(I)yrinic acid a,c-diamide adenosyltransferase [Desulfovibrionaceae bacterium]|nr:cob(I)yrinic acid a,c-diamide adenosyltransferase [Desulfovibrionaceae bacterium]
MSKSGVPFEIHRSCAQKVLAWAHANLTKVDLLVLDELCYALHYELITEEEVQDLINKARCHLVFSGRFAPPWLVDAADLVTIMDSPKHPKMQGVSARPGLEY